MTQEELDLLHGYLNGTLNDGEFARLLDDIVTPDVFTAARVLRERNALTREDGTPLL